MSFTDAAQRRLPESLFGFVGRNRVLSGEITDLYLANCTSAGSAIDWDVPINLRRVKDGVGSALAYIPEPIAEAMQAWIEMSSLRARAQACLAALADAPQDVVVASFTRDIGQSVAAVDRVLGEHW